VKPHVETTAGVAFIPVVATMGFYGLPAEWQIQPSIQIAPQLIAYSVLGLWMYRNKYPLDKLGLAFNKIQPGLYLGTVTGLTLGTVNTLVILYLIPSLNLDIRFLTRTPHAQVPFWMMVPWFIITIAMLVELNFRGFLLGRLLVFFNALKTDDRSFPGIPLTRLLPISISAFTFSFDPFLVNTFRHLHWIALWDGLVWGWMWMRMRNLYMVMTAHAVEVVMVYLILRGMLA